MLNSAALLYVAGKATDLIHGVQLAREVIQNGRVKANCEEFGRLVRKGVEQAKVNGIH